EMWGLLTLYQALRSVMVTAVETLPGCDPDRAGFTVALEAARDTVVSLVATTATPGPGSRSDLVGHIGAHVLHALLPGRRMRLSARIVKCGTSRYNIWNRDGRPRGSTAITAIEITVHPPALPSTQDPSRALSGRWGLPSWTRSASRPDGSMFPRSPTAQSFKKPSLRPSPLLAARFCWAIWAQRR
ncbi:hypothetical protein ACFYR3_41375, partial [Streptomyces sp. NPDC005784]